MFEFPLKRIEGIRSDRKVKLSKEAKLFIPYTDLYPVQGFADRFRYLSIYPVENLSRLLNTKLRSENFTISLTETENAIELEVPSRSLEHLRPSSESIVIVGLGYTFELWDGKSFQVYVREKIEEWDSQGSIDTVLKMEKWHPWSRLRGRVTVQPISEHEYRTLAELTAFGIVLHRLNYVTSGRRNTTNDLGRRVISLYDAYIEGATNDPQILAVHEVFKIK